MDQQSQQQEDQQESSEQKSLYHICGQPIEVHIFHNQLVDGVRLEQRGRHWKRIECTYRTDVTRYYDGTQDHHGSSLPLDALAITRCPNCQFELKSNLLFERNTGTLLADALAAALRIAKYPAVSPEQSAERFETTLDALWKGAEIFRNLVKQVERMQKDWKFDQDYPSIRKEHPEQGGEA